MRAAGRVHTGRPVHGRQGWRQGYCAAERMRTVRRCPREGARGSRGHILTRSRAQLEANPSTSCKHTRESARGL